VSQVGDLFANLSDLFVTQDSAVATGKNRRKITTETQRAREDMEIWGQTPNSSLCSLCLCGDFSSIFPDQKTSSASDFALLHAYSWIEQCVADIDGKIRHNNER